MIGRPSRGSLRRRLLVNLGVQFLLISAVALASVYAVRYVFGEVLMRRALELEAEHFVAGRRADPAYPLPLTRNLVSYLGSETAPAWLRGLGPGFHRHVRRGPEQMHPVYVHNFEGRRLYLLFRADQVDQLVLYFGLIPLACVLLALYLTAYLGYVYTRRSVSPIISLAERVSRLPADAAGTELTRDYADGEVGVLARALDRYARRLAGLVQRERAFTGDASHELRTAVTIIGNSAELLCGDASLSPVARRRAETIHAASRDLGEVLSVLLLLARETDSKESAERCEVGEIAAQELERCRLLFAAQSPDLHLHRLAALPVQAPSPAVGIVLGNLLRNACSYSQDGPISVTVLETSVTIADSGPGIPEQEIDNALAGHYRARGASHAGKGLGLAIVQRVCERYGWRVQLTHRRPTGLIATVSFVS